MLVRQISFVNAVILLYFFSQPKIGPGSSYSQPVTVMLPAGWVNDEEKEEFGVQNKKNFALL